MNSSTRSLTGGRHEQQLPEVQAGRCRVAFVVVGNVFEEREELLNQRLRRVHTGERLAPRSVDVLAEDRDEQVLFGRDVQVERSNGDAGRIGDRCGRGALESPLCEQAPSGGHDPSPLLDLVVFAPANRPLGVVHGPARVPRCAAATRPDDLEPPTLSKSNRKWRPRDGCNGSCVMTAIKLVLSMSENWTIWDPRDARAAIDGAVKAEQAGFDGVLFSEHLVLGQGSDANGVPMQPARFRHASQPGAELSVAQLDRFDVGRGDGDHPGADHRRGGDRTAAAPPAARQGVGHPRPAGEWSPRHSADRQLASGRVRGLRGALQPSRRHPR